ncbi:hypothetical protein VTK26DRAFT_8528 [Humicola hyalothermophila]
MHCRLCDCHLSIRYRFPRCSFTFKRASPHNRIAMKTANSLRISMFSPPNAESFPTLGRALYSEFRSNSP